MDKLYRQYVDFDADGNQFLVMEFENSEKYRFPFKSWVNQNDIVKCIEKYKLNRRKEKIDKLINGRK